MSALKLVQNQETGYNVSDKYKIIQTADILSHFENAGYTVSSVSVAKVNNPNKQGYQKHLIRLRHPNIDFKIDGLVPELILKNSYDGSTSFNLKIGVFRIACANGLEVGTTFKSESVRHTGNNILERVLAACERIKTEFPLLQEQINLMASINLSNEQQLGFAEVIQQYLLKDNSSVVQTKASHLLSLKRYQDESNDLFTVLNVIQENSLKGNYKYITSKIDPIHKGVIRRVMTGRKVKSIDKTSKINTFIWDQALKLIA